MEANRAVSGTAMRVVEPSFPARQALVEAARLAREKNDGGSSRRGFGYSADRAEVISAEAEAIRDAARRVLDGETLSNIVQEWNRRGLRTAGGGPWRVNSLSSLLVQPRLAGLGPAGSRAERLPAPAILDPDTHRQLLELHQSRRKGPRRPTRQYLLTGLLRCWRCGGGLRGMPRPRAADLYVCPGPPHGGCSGTAVTADHAETAVRDLVLDRLDSPVFMEAVAARAERASRHEARLRQVVGQLATGRSQLDDLGELWAAGEISRDEWLSLRRNLATRAKGAEAELTRLARVEDQRRLTGGGRAMRARWDAMSVEERRGVLRTTLDHVVVHPAEPPRQVFRPERLEPVWLS